MLEQQATVVNIDDQGGVWVFATRQSACGACEQKTACHTPSVLTAPSSSVKVQANNYPLIIGDEVLISIAEQTIWHGLLYLYVYPLLALLVGALLGQYLAGELGAILGAIGLTALVLLHVKQLTQQQNDNYLPTVIKKLK